ncbi:MAG: hypothetical protein JWQ27_63 [Ferruginibacter sp.]|nr:hypothetical protein [Ferruginibacter sp.]
MEETLPFTSANHWLLVYKFSFAIGRDFGRTVSQFPTAQSRERLLLTCETLPCTYFMDIKLIKEELTSQFPEYSFFLSRRLTGRCIVAIKTKYNGADIFVKKHRVVIEAGIPEWKTRLILGAGAAYRKVTDKGFYDVALRVSDFLSKKYVVSVQK